MIKISKRNFQVKSIVYTVSESDFLKLPRYKQIMLTEEFVFQGKNNKFLISKALNYKFEFGEQGTVIKIYNPTKNEENGNNVFSYIFNFEKNEFEKIIGPIENSQRSDFITALEKTIEHENDDIYRP